MKTKYIISLVLVLFVLTSCEKENAEDLITVEDYVGTWYSAERRDSIVVDSNLSEIKYYKTGSNLSTVSAIIDDDGISFTIKYTLSSNGARFSYHIDVEGILSSPETLDVTQVYYKSQIPNGGVEKTDPESWGRYEHQ